MFQRLCTYFQDTGVLIFGGYVLSGHCNQQQISVKTEGVLIFGGVLIYGVLRYFQTLLKIEKEIAREVARIDKHCLKKSADRKAHFSLVSEMNAFLADLCFAICRFSPVVFITSSNLAQNLVSLFPIVLVTIWFLFSMARMMVLQYIRSFVFGSETISCRAVWERWNDTDISSEHSLCTCTQVRRNLRKSDVVYACKKKKKNATKVTVSCIWLYAVEPSLCGGHPCAHRLFLPGIISQVHRFL